MEIIITIIACGIAYILIGEVIVPHKSKGWPGNKYREPKD